MGKTAFSVRAALLIAGLAAAAALALPASASAAVSCTFAANTLTVNVTGTGDQQVGLRMEDSGTEIGVFSAINFSAQQTCDVDPVPAASTNTIVVNDTDPGAQRTLVKVALTGGPFVNGNPDGEGTGDREIEIQIDGGNEATDDLILDPGPGATDDNWRMGDLSNSTGDEGINLNDAEPAPDNDVDDIHLVNMEQLQATINGNDGDDILDARGGDGFVGPMTMTSTTKQLVGGNGNDQIYAGAGNNWRVEGDNGADTMIGGSGDDLLQAAFGADPDIVDANGGNDFCSWQNHNDPVTIDLKITIPQDTVGAGMDTISDCEQLIGGQGGDTLIGDGGANSLFGLDGDDTLRPGTGAVNDVVDGGVGTGDTVDYSDMATLGATVSLAIAGPQNTIGYGMDTISNTENVVGTPFADTLIGNAEANRIEGGDGGDNITLGDQDDVFDSYDAQADTVDCGDGTDSGFASEPNVDSLTACETPDFAPDTTIANGPDDGILTNDDTPTYELTASEGSVEFQVSVDNGPYSTCAASCPTPPLPDGAHTLRFRAVETAGAEHPDPTPAVRTVTVDRQAPSLSITGGPTGDTTDSTPTFAWASNDAEATFECSVDGTAFGPCSDLTSHTTPALPLGAHNFMVRATDPVGNATTASRNFRIVQPADTTAPETKIGKVKVKGSKVTVRFSSTEKGSTFRCKLDRKKARACKSPKRFRDLAEGRHKLKVTAIDAAGNADKSPAKVRFKVR